MGEPIVVWPPVPSSCSDCHTVVPGGNTQAVSISQSHTVHNAASYRQHADSMAAIGIGLVLVATLIVRKVF